MALVTESWLMDCLFFLLFLLFLLYRYIDKTFSYFKTKGVPYLSGANIMLFNDAMTEVYRSLYKKFPEEKLFGYFQIVEPHFIIKDIDLVQRIMVKDFHHFQDRGFAVIERDFLNSKTLFSLKGQTWRSLRNKLSPTFTSGKLKLMFGQFTKSGDHLLMFIEKELGKPFDAKQLSVEFATEVIASTAFGLDFSKENPQSIEFVDRITNAFRTTYRMMVTFYIALFSPKLAGFLRLSFTPPSTEKYIVNLVKATKEYRKKNNFKRNDYFDLLLELQQAEENGTSIVSLSGTDDGDDAYLINQLDSATEETDSTLKTGTKLLTDKVLAAQAFVFFVGGSESVSGTIAFALYYIAKNPAVQKELNKEVETVLARHGGCTYQAVSELRYMDMVLQETLRLQPILPITMRECVFPYHIPDTDLVLEKGAKVVIPVAGIHMDPKYYPEPELFKPERFADYNHRSSSIYMPFGDGPRICIAMRFAIVEMKVCLLKILTHYDLEVNSKTQEPLVLDKKSFSPKAQGGIWLDLKKR